MQETTLFKDIFSQLFGLLFIMKEKKSESLFFKTIRNLSIFFSCFRRPSIIVVMLWCLGKLPTFNLENRFTFLKKISNEFILEIIFFGFLITFMFGQSRWTYFSTFIDELITWKKMFFENTLAMWSFRVLVTILTTLNKNSLVLFKHQGISMLDF